VLVTIVYVNFDCTKGALIGEETNKTRI